MSEQTVERLRRLGACEDGRESTRDYDTIGDWWMTINRADWMLWLAERLGLDERRLRLFAVWCARQVQHLMTDDRSINALDVAECHAHGDATDEETRAAWAAEAAARAAEAAARVAEAAAGAARAGVPAEAAVWAAGAAAWVAEAAAEAAAAEAAAAARAARAAQSDKLREMFPACEINKLWSKLTSEKTKIEEVKK
jgi:hypothetical protein